MSQPTPSQPTPSQPTPSQPTPQSTVLVLGATGKTGRRVVQGLTGSSHLVRGVSRRSDPPFIWADRSTWEPALRGADSVYVAYVPDLAAPGAAEDIEDLTVRASAAGVRRMVLLSGRGEAGAVRCEQIVAASRLEHVIVRASWFNQNFSEGYLLDQVRQGFIALPAAEMAEPFVDADDIADVAIAALTEDHHAGRIYELTGPRLLTFHAAAAEISQAIGREVNYLPVTPQQFHTAVTEDAGTETADLLTALCEEVFDGRNANLAAGVMQALGRPPRDFTDFCRAAAATGAWS